MCADVNTLKIGVTNIKIQQIKWWIFSKFCYAYLEARCVPENILVVADASDLADMP
jgi:hypothetical protein